MTIKASGRAALILATGLFVWFAGPSQAATDEDDGAINAETAAGPPIALNRYASPGSHRRHAHRRSGKVALKSSASTKAAEVAASNNSPPTIPPSVADAKAQMNAAEMPAANGEEPAERRAGDHLLDRHRPRPFGDPAGAAEHLHRGQCQQRGARDHHRQRPGRVPRHAAGVPREEPRPTAGQQGRSAADDAAAAAQALGLPDGSPLWFDMEGYRLGDATCTKAVQSFVSAWHSELHAQGYVSGVYGSAASTMRDVAALGSAKPDNAWIANWNDLTEFEVIPVVTSAQASAAIK